MLARSRVTAVAALATVLLTAVLPLAVGGPASAGTEQDTTADTITIATPVTVTRLGGAGGETLTVTAESTTPLVSMTVHLLNAASDADSLDLTMQPPTGAGSGGGGTQAATSAWTSDAITTATLPLGDYDITVDAADSGGTTVTGVTAGTLPFQDTPRIVQAAGNYVITSANKHPVINGTITELAPGASKPTPYAKQPIVLDDPVEGDIRLTTNGAGAYREVLPKPKGGETITAVVPSTATTQATKATPVLLTVHTVITGFTATLNPFWQLTYHGCLGLPAGIPGNVPALAGTVIQYSAGPHGPWHPLGTVPAGQRGFVCGNDGRTFTGVLTARLANAYYRASYAGTAAQRQTTGDLPSTSAAAHAWKYVVRIAGLTVSKRTVKKGAKLTVSGRLQYEFDGKWRALAHGLVQVILLPPHSHTWYWIARIKTGAKGNFSATFTDPVTATWSAEYLGDGTHLAAVGAMIPVTLSG